jgi:hypothetical protein
MTQSAFYSCTNLSSVYYTGTPEEWSAITIGDYNDLHFLNCAWPLADKIVQEEKVSKRKEVKAIIKELKKDNPDVDEAIFRSIHNVNMSTMVAWRKNGIHHTFLEDYEEEKE